MWGAFAGVFSLVMLAQTTEIPAWAQYGILGFIILGFLTQQIVPGWHYKRQEQELQQLKQENTKLVKLILDTQAQTLPALQEGTIALREAQRELRRLRYQEG